MARKRFDAVQGALSVGIAPSDTTIQSPGLARMGTVASPDTALVCLFVEDSNGNVTAAENVYVTAHTAGSTSATVTRAGDGTTAQTWIVGTTWSHGLGVADVADIESNTNALPLSGGTMTGPIKSLLDYNGTVYNVKAWGAKGDGTTNDTSAIQNCINAAVYGATVYFPKGTYLISSTLQVQPYVRYRGSHRSETFIKQANGANLDAMMASPFWYASTTAAADGSINIESLGFNGNRANQTGGLGHGIILVSFWNELRDLEITNCYGDGLNITCASKTGVEITGSAVETHISRVDVRNCGGVGIHVYCPGGASYDLNTDGWIHDCIVQNPSDVGIRIDSAGGWDISGNHLYGCPTDGIVVNNSFNTRIHHNYVETWGTAPNVLAVTSGSDQATYTQSNVFSQPALRVGTTLVNGTGTVLANTTVTAISSTPTVSGSNYVWTVTLSANATGTGNTTAPLTYYAIAAGTGSDTFAGPNYGTVIDHNVIFQVASGVASVNSVTGIVYTAYNGSGQVFMVNIEGNTLHNFFPYWVALKINMQPGGNGTIFAKVDNNNTIGWASRFTSSMASGTLNITGDVYGSAISSSATDGFARLPGTAATPTGTPDTTTGIPVIVDTANSSIYGYISGAWTALGSSAGVTSFNTRTGTVTLSKADVTGTGLAAADVSALSTSATASGDVTGTLGSTLTVAQIQGKAVSSTAPTDAQILVYKTGTGWVPVSLSSGLTITNAGVATATDSTKLATANNLSELAATASTARTNLGLGTAATTASTAYVAASGVTAADTSIVIAGTATAPTIKTGTLDVIATQHPPAAAVAMNSQKITGLANGTATTDAAAFGQIPTINAPTPASSGLKAWSMDPAAQSSNGLALTSGVMLLAQINLDHSTTLTNVLFKVGSTAAATQTTGLVGLYTQAGVLLSGSTNATNWTSTLTGYTIALGSAQTVGPGVFYVGILVQATTMPNLQGSGSGALTLGASVSSGTLAGGARALTYGTGQSALPTTISGTPAVSQSLFTVALT